jgi:hypothetical protein
MLTLPIDISHLSSASLMMMLMVTRQPKHVEAADFRSEGFVKLPALRSRLYTTHIVLP